MTSLCSLRVSFTDLFFTMPSCCVRCYFTDSMKSYSLRPVVPFIGFRCSLLLGAFVWLGVHEIPATRQAFSPPPPQQVFVGRIFPRVGRLPSPVSSVGRVVYTGVTLPHQLFRVEDGVSGPSGFQGPGF